MKNLERTQTEVSPISFDEQRLANFICSVKEHSSLSIILQDELGRAKFHGTYPLSPGENKITLLLPELSSGNYNAWIEVLGETFIRPLEVETSEKPGILGRFKQFLNLF